MNISFWPFLWFGLPGRLLRIVSSRMADLRDGQNTVSENAVSSTEVGEEFRKAPSVGAGTCGIWGYRALRAQKLKKFKIALRD